MKSSLLLILIFLPAISSFCQSWFFPSDDFNLIRSRRKQCLISDTAHATERSQLSTGEVRHHTDDDRSPQTATIDIPKSGKKEYIKVIQLELESESVLSLIQF